MTGGSQTPVLYRAQAEDRAEVEACVEAAYGPYRDRLGFSPAPLLEDYGRVIAEHEVWVAKADDATVGVLVLIPAPGSLLLDNVAVAPEWQGTGLGRRLLAWAEHRALEQGCSAIELYTNAAMSDNLAIYQRLGYQVVGRCFDGGYDRVFMRKSDLNPARVSGDLASD